MEAACIMGGPREGGGTALEMTHIRQHAAVSGFYDSDAYKGFPSPKKTGHINKNGPEGPL